MPRLKMRKSEKKAPVGGCKECGSRNAEVGKKAKVGRWEVEKVGRWEGEKLGR